MVTQIILHLHNRTKNPVDEGMLKQSATQILQHVSIADIVEVNVTISGADYIRQLNRRYRDIDRPTDVLSFPIIPLVRGQLTKDLAPINHNLPMHLGDIVIAYPVAAKQANEHGHNVETEIRLLFEHGLKHLLGFHHR